MVGMGSAHGTVKSEHARQSYLLQGCGMKTKFWRGAAVAASLIFSATVAQTASAQFRLNFVGSANVGNQPGSGGANLLVNFVNPIRAVPTTTPRSVRTDTAVVASGLETTGALS